MARTTIRKLESYSVAGVPPSPIVFVDQFPTTAAACVRNGTGHRMVLTLTVHVLHSGSEKSFRSGHHDFSVAVAAGVSCKDQARQLRGDDRAAVQPDADVTLVAAGDKHSMHRPDFPPSRPRPGCDLVISLRSMPGAPATCCPPLWT